MPVRPQPHVPFMLFWFGEMPRDRLEEKQRNDHHDRNVAVLLSSLDELMAPQNRGRGGCVAGGELFLAENMDVAIALGQTAHPEDDGWFGFPIVVQPPPGPIRLGGVMFNHLFRGLPYEPPRIVEGAEDC
jgi:hypothetical protein